ncbi:hypothetical protein GXW82_42225 [Streptacidiphilus sp. 4-A2]|nr:hypothetical protein [Streptacidiphilus sp. 4-A2]
MSWAGVDGPRSAARSVFSMIAANAIELRAGARILIESASFRVAPGPHRPGRP